MPQNPKVRQGPTKSRQAERKAETKGGKEAVILHTSSVNSVKCINSQASETETDQHTACGVSAADTPVITVADDIAERTIQIGS